MRKVPGGLKIEQVTISSQEAGLGMESGEGLCVNHSMLFDFFRRCL